MTLQSVPTSPSATARIKAVWELYGTRSEQNSTGDQVYAIYIFALFSALYLVPIVYVTGQLQPLISVARTAGTGLGSSSSHLSPSIKSNLVAAAGLDLGLLFSVMVVACWACLLFGRLWGPVVLRPFLLHVFTETDLSPEKYLAPVARRRMLGAGTGLLVTLLALCYMFTDFFTAPTLAALGIGICTSFSLLLAGLWIRGQVQSTRRNVVTAIGIMVAAVICFFAWWAVVSFMPGGLSTQVGSTFSDAALAQIGNVALVGNADLVGSTALVGNADLVGSTALVGNADLVGSTALVGNADLVSFTSNAAIAEQDAATAQLGGALFFILLIAALAGAGLLFWKRGLVQLRTLDLDRLRTDSARAAAAQVFTTTGSFHHAFDLFQPEPRGHTGALVRDGSASGPTIAGYLSQGWIRALRTPSRLSTAIVVLTLGTGLLSAYLGGLLGAIPISGWVLAGILLYIGFGKITGTWKSLLGELSLAPLYAPNHSGIFFRNLLWPLTAFTLVCLVGSGATALASMISASWANLAWNDSVALGNTAQSVATAIGYFLLTAGLAFAARFLREMKVEIPAKLLYPITTPLGDISGLRVVLWQFDGLIALLIGIIILHAVTPSVTAAALALAITGYCFWMGLRQANGRT